MLQLFLLETRVSAEMNIQTLRLHLESERDGYDVMIT